MATPALTSPPETVLVKPRRAGFRYWHETVLVALLLGVLLYAAKTDPSFLKISSQTDALSNIWQTALIAVPMTLIIITGGIDLSVGSTMALAAVVLGLTFERGLSPWLGSALAVLVGAGAGAVNGFFVTKVKVHPLILTLATLSAYRGIAAGVSLARPISGFPPSFLALSNGVPAILFALWAGGAAFLLAKTAPGLLIYGIGHNETAMRYSGWRVDRAKFWLYTCSGATAGLAGVEYVARFNTAKADIGTGMELDVITAVVLGGTSIFGGRGGIGGTLLGLLLIHEVREFVSWHWNRDEFNFIVVGALLVFSVLLNSFLSKPERE